jgi:hypothetical protein
MLCYAMLCYAMLYAAAPNKKRYFLSNTVFFRKIESVVKNVKFAIRINKKTGVRLTTSNIKQTVDK